MFGVLLGVSAVYVLLALLLVRALAARSVAEREAAAAQEREAQLEQYQQSLEQQVEQRTDELSRANDLLEAELATRRAAEAELKQHDALLHSVAKSAAELLGAHSHEEALDSVLELVGRTVGATRVQVNSLRTDLDGHLRSTILHEWCVAGASAMVDHPHLQDLDLTVEYPSVAVALLAERMTTFTTADLAASRRPVLRAASFLQIPIKAEGKLWGSVLFIDASTEQRVWSWAETDTLETLAGLIGAAITRARYVKELADANMIVQNSPTILYRVRGEPPFRLIYVSHNVRKYGHEPENLIGIDDWASSLMDEEDQARLCKAMARTLDRDTDGASIEFRLRHRDDGYRWVENRYTPVRDRHGRLIEIEGMIIDITERKAAEEKIALLARTDALTGLANRATFLERLRSAFAAAQRGAAPFAILYLDLDHFKAVNDTFGHTVGDQLLKMTAERLRRCTRETDTVARLGGDEFAILQTEIAEPANAGSLADAIRLSVERPFVIDGNDLHVTSSIGICPYANGSPSPEVMLTQADLALYRSKEEGRNRYRFHSDDLDQQVQARVVLADELREAIDGGQLELYYQPQVELSSHRIVGMEAFVRWHHPKRGLLPASEFIAVAEKTGTIIVLGQWVLERACRQMREWKDLGVAPPVMTMNLSLAQLKGGKEFIDDVRQALEKWGLSPSDLSFDVTEATLAQITLMRSDVLADLRRIGVGLAIDDFGSEYSSFDYLRTYRVNHLKITPAWLDSAEQDKDRAATVRAIVNLARELGIDVVTEGVETEQQLDLSTTTSVIAQGFYFSDALGADAANEVLRRGTIQPSAEHAEHATARVLTAMVAAPTGTDDEEREAGEDSALPRRSPLADDRHDERPRAGSDGRRTP